MPPRGWLMHNQRIIQVMYNDKLVYEDEDHIWADSLLQETGIRTFQHIFLVASSNKIWAPIQFCSHLLYMFRPKKEVQS